MSTTPTFEPVVTGEFLRSVTESRDGRFVKWHRIMCITQFESVGNEIVFRTSDSDDAPSYVAARASNDAAARKALFALMKLISPPEPPQGE